MSSNLLNTGKETTVYQSLVDKIIKFRTRGFQFRIPKLEVIATVSQCESVQFYFLLSSRCSEYLFISHLTICSPRFLREKCLTNQNFVPGNIKTGVKDQVKWKFKVNSKTLKRDKTFKRFQRQTVQHSNGQNSKSLPHRMLEMPGKIEETETTSIDSTLAAKYPFIVTEPTT